MDPAAAAVEPLPGLPGFPYLHRGAGAVIVGPTGGGRSSLLQAGLYDAARAGLRCAYLGSEITEPEFNARAAILAQRRGDQVDDELRAALARVRYLNLASVMPRAWKDPQEWIDTITANYEIVITDPLSAVAAALGLDFDKSNADFVLWYDRLAQPLVTAGITFATPDNVGHAQEAKRRAKGASAKSDRVDLTFSCAASANPVGLTIRAHKVRSVRAGHREGDEWLFVRDTQRIQARGHTPAATTTAFRPTTIMQRVSETLEHDQGLSRNAIRTSIGGKAEYVDLALELLISEGHVEVVKTSQAHRHHCLKPYRGDTESRESQPSPGLTKDPVRPTESRPSPNQVPDPHPDTESHRVPPLKGGPVTGPGSDTNDNGHDDDWLQALIDSHPEQEHV